MYQYKTTGTCSQLINFDVEEGKVRNVSFIGGCNGNLQGIGKLVEGMDAEEVIAKLGGIRCGFKPTSCPDQLATALRQVVEAAAPEAEAEAEAAPEAAEEPAAEAPAEAE